MVAYWAEIIGVGWGYDVVESVEEGAALSRWESAHDVVEYEGDVGPEGGRFDFGVEVEFALLVFVDEGDGRDGMVVCLLADFPAGGGAKGVVAIQAAHLKSLLEFERRFAADGAGD